MTTIELIKQLKKLPANANIIVWDPKRDIPTDRVQLDYDNKRNDIMITNEV